MYWISDVTLLRASRRAHSHHRSNVGDPLADLAVVKDYASYGAILELPMHGTRDGGITTIRVVGSSNFDDMALGRQLPMGEWRPRMENAGHAIGLPAACDENGFRPA